MYDDSVLQFNLQADVILATGSRYIDSARTQRKTSSIVDEACLPLGCLAIVVLLLSAIVCWGGGDTQRVDTSQYLS
jgi:hypothetical protein